MAKADKGAKKGKGGKKGKAQSEWPVISVSAHPRASNAIVKMKAWAGLIGFVGVGVLSYQAGVEPFESLLRALAAGIALYVIAWMAGVTLWRSLVVEEARQEGERRRATLEEQLRVARAKAEGNGTGTNGDEEAA
jgi:hypothetical protein